MASTSLLLTWFHFNTEFSRCSNGLPILPYLANTSAGHQSKIFSCVCVCAYVKIDHSYPPGKSCSIQDDLMYIYAWLPNGLQTLSYHDTKSPITSLGCWSLGNVRPQRTERPGAYHCGVYSVNNHSDGNSKNCWISGKEVFWFFGESHWLSRHWMWLPIAAKPASLPRFSVASCEMEILYCYATNSMHAYQQLRMCTLWVSAPRLVEGRQSSDSRERKTRYLQCAHLTWRRHSINSGLTLCPHGPLHACIPTATNV